MLLQLLIAATTTSAPKISVNWSGEKKTTPTFWPFTWQP